MPGDTETHHEPSPDEIEHAERGELHHPGDLAGEAHGPDDHGEGHGHDDHAHGEEVLGPVDTARWGAFVLGVAAGLVVAVCLILTVAVIGAAPAI